MQCGAPGALPSVCNFGSDALASVAPYALAQRAVPETVKFMSADGKTTLVGYIFKPDHAKKNVSPRWS